MSMIGIVESKRHLLSCAESLKEQSIALHWQAESIERQARSLDEQARLYREVADGMKDES